MWPLATLPRAVTPPPNYKLPSALRSCTAGDACVSLRKRRPQLNWPQAAAARLDALENDGAAPNRLAPLDLGAGGSDDEYLVPGDSDSDAADREVPFLRMSQRCCPKPAGHGSADQPGRQRL